MIEPQPNPETVEALLDTTRRLAGAETARTDALDRKAATVASFVSLVAALTATVGLPTWQEIRKTPEQVRGETMRTLVEAIARERSTTNEKLRWLRWSFKLLLVGLAIVAAESATLAVEEVRQ